MYIFIKYMIKVNFFNIFSALLGAFSLRLSVECPAAHAQDLHLSENLVI